MSSTKDDLFALWDLESSRTIQPYFFSSSSSNDTHSAAIIVKSTPGATVTTGPAHFSNLPHQTSPAGKELTVRIFISKDLSHVEDAARDVRDGFAAKGDAGGAVVPGAADVELDFSAVGLVLEGEG